MKYLERYIDIDPAQPTSSTNGIPALNTMTKAKLWHQFNICVEAMQTCNCEISDARNRLSCRTVEDWNQSARHVGLWVERRDLWRKAANNIAGGAKEKEIRDIESNGVALLEDYKDDGIFSAPIFMVVDAHEYNNNPENDTVCRPALTKQVTGSSSMYGDNRETELVFGSGFHSRQALTWKTTKGALNNALKVRGRGTIEVIAAHNSFWGEDADLPKDEQSDRRRNDLFGRRVLGQLHPYRQV